MTDHNIPEECVNAFKKMGALEQKVDNQHSDMLEVYRDMRKDYRQLLYAFCALIAAILGVKIVGSPPWDDIRAFVAAFSGAFVMAFLVFEWKNLQWWKRVMIFLFSVLVILSTFSRLLIFQPGIETSPLWYTFVIDTLLIAISITLVVSLWKYKWK